MKTNRTKAIVLRRLNYGESDRIITLLTEDFGKITLIAKGVRREKSKLAGGIEIFCENDISFVRGRGDMGTLISSKLERYFDLVQKDYDRLQLMANYLKKIDEVTEDESGKEYYSLAINTLLAMNTSTIPKELSASWAILQLLLNLGEVINVERDSLGKPFSDTQQYHFAYELCQFVPDNNGLIKPEVIKFIRFLGAESPARAARISGAAELANESYKILESAYRYNRPLTR